MSINPKRFTEELLKIGGFNRFGDPRLILVHGTECRFHPTGPLKYIIERQRKQEIKANDETGIIEVKYKFEDVGLNRWVIEEWVPPEFLFDHNQNRYGKDELGETVDILGPFPSRGKYRALMILETKEGKAIPLDSRLLDFLRKCKYETFENIKHSETETPTLEEVKAGLEDYVLKTTKQQIAMQQQLFDMVDDAFKPHRHRLTLANHTEGMHSAYRRGRTYNPNNKKDEYDSNRIN